MCEILTIIKIKWSDSFVNFVGAWGDWSKKKVEKANILWALRLAGWWAFPAYYPIFNLIFSTISCHRDATQTSAPATGFLKF